jgi:type II secretory pathway pseudopilin PulG
VLACQPRARRSACRAPADAAGATLLELLFALAVTSTLAGMATPAIADALDEMRTAAAARYIAARIGSARLDAVRHSQATALRFELSPAVADGRDQDYAFAPIVDGNGNGVRSTEIRQGIDRAAGPSETLCEKFPGVRFELMPTAPDADGVRNTGNDGVRVGSAGILTMSPDGTATSGTLYIRGQRSQYAVRVLGVTGRTRMLQYQAGNGSWINR